MVNLYESCSYILHHLKLQQQKCLAYMYQHFCSPLNPKQPHPPPSKKNRKDPHPPVVTTSSRIAFRLQVLCGQLLPSWQHRKLPGAKTHPVATTKFFFVFEGLQGFWLLLIPPIGDFPQQKKRMLYQPTRKEDANHDD